MTTRDADAFEVMGILTLLLSKYKDQKPQLQAEHSILYIPGPPGKELSPEEMSKLKELGAFWSKRNKSWAVRVEYTTRPPW